MGRKKLTNYLDKIVIKKKRESAHSAEMYLMSTHRLIYVEQAKSANSLLIHRNNTENMHTFACVHTVFFFPLCPACARNAHAYTCMSTITFSE